MAGGLIYFFLCSFWFALLGITTGWEPVLEFFLSDNLGRFVSVDFGPQRGPFYYVGVFLGDFFPWSFFFPAAVIWTLRKKNGSGGEEEKAHHWMLLSLWMGTYFLFFSLSHNKQEYYILPLYPAAALWVALYFKQARPSMILSGIVSTLLALLALSLFGILRVLFEEAWLWLPLLFVPALVWGFVRRHYTLALASLALFYFASFALYLQPLEKYKPVHHFAERITTDEEQQNFQAGYYKFAAPSLAFYLDQPIFELDDLQAAVALLESEVTVYMIVSAEDYSELTQATRQPLRIVEERPKLYTTARTLIEGFRRDRSDNLRESWTRPSTSSPIEETSEAGLELSIIIPVFNELETLEPLYDRLKQSLTAWESSCEILFINDGSSDGSSEELQRLAALDQRVRVLEFVRNFGQTAAIAAGFDYARGKIIIPLDADLQNDPQDIPRIMEKLGEGYDVVNCWRQDRKDPWLTRILPSRLANRLISWISGVYLHDYGCTLKGYRRNIVRHIRLYGEMHRFIPIFASWAGARVTEIPVRHHARRFGESKYGMIRTVKVLLDLITVKFLGSYSTKPMYLFGSLGLLSFLGGSLLSAVTLYQKFFEAVKAHRKPLTVALHFPFYSRAPIHLFRTGG